jgi:hypothetical protein
VKHPSPDPDIYISLISIFENLQRCNDNLKLNVNTIFALFSVFAGGTFSAAALWVLWPAKKYFL